MALSDWLKGKANELAERAKSAPLGEALKEKAADLAERVKKVPVGDILRDAATEFSKHAETAGKYVAAEAKTVRARVEQAKAEYEAQAAEAKAERQAEAEQARLAEAENQRLWAILDLRFKPFRFPRIPPEMTKDFRDAPNMREDLAMWAAILDDWPSDPTDDTDRQEREDKYWSIELDKYLTRNPDGDVVLWPKQKIIDEWWGYEKWHFRRYYAATGIFHPSVLSSPLVEHWKTKDSFKHKKSWNTTNATEMGNKQRRDEAVRFIDNLFDVTIPAHIEKWGSWYFFNIEQAFKKKFAPPPRKFAKPSDDL